MRLVLLLTLLAACSAAPVAARRFLPGVATPLNFVEALPLDGCSCVLYRADCPEAKEEFICMSGCIQRGHEFPGRCDTVLGCCVSLKTINDAIRCVDAGSSVEFYCGGSNQTTMLGPCRASLVVPL